MSTALQVISGERQVAVQETSLAAQYQQDKAALGRLIQEFGGQMQAMKEQNKALVERVDLLDQRDVVKALELAELSKRVLILGDENKALRDGISKGAEELAKTLQANHELQGQLNKDLQNVLLRVQKARLDHYITKLANELDVDQKELDSPHTGGAVGGALYGLAVGAAGGPVIAVGSSIFFAVWGAKSVREATSILLKERIKALQTEIEEKKHELEKLG